ncbi:MAG: hypothetical protein AABY86_05525 [Bdellovibrionota bacterium]
MDKSLFVNGIHLNYIMSLKKWRVLNLKSVFKESQYPGSYSTFRKIITSLESKNLIKSYQDPFSSKKYLFLTEHGEAYVGAKEGRPALSNETLLHDSKVVEICMLLTDFSAIKEVELEHQLVDRTSFKSTYRICPDALIHGERKGQKFRMAFELELTQKTKAKYLAKIQQYLDSSAYDYVFYFFPGDGVYTSYKEHITETFSEKAFSKIIMGVNQTLLTKKFDIKKTKIHFQNKEVDIEILFGN